MFDFENYPKALLEIKPSKVIVGEVGLFVMRNLRKNDLVASDKDFGKMKTMPYKYFDKLDRITKKRIRNFCVEVENGFWVPENINNINIPWHNNHSCEPNVYVDANYDCRALRNIKKGEELFFDFSTIWTNPRYKLICKCGSENCKKIVTGKDKSLCVKKVSKVGKALRNSA